MKKITNKEYEAYMRYKEALLNGRILTPEYLDNIIQACNNDAYAVGNHMMEANLRFKNGRHSLSAWLDR